jgi:hypothetical protein
MTRWLAAARSVSGCLTKPTELTKNTRFRKRGIDTTLWVYCRLSQFCQKGEAKSAVLPTPASAPPLDPEGLPFTTRPACGGGLLWKDAALPPEGPGPGLRGLPPAPGRGVAARLRGAGGGHVMTGLPITVRPGPVAHDWRDGQEVARVQLDVIGALALIAALAGEVRATQAGGGTGGERAVTPRVPLAGHGKPQERP